MTQIQWTRNDNSGAFVERQLRAIQAYIEKSSDASQKLEMLKTYTYIWDMKARIAKNHDLEKRIEELERIAGIAKQGVIAQ